MTPPAAGPSPAPNSRWLDALDARWLLAAVLLVLMGAAAGFVRYAVLGQATWTFLVKNLLLAAVPAAMALVLRRFARAPLPVFGLVFFAWLVFLPNAPYIVTDVIHIATPRRTIAWMDVLVVGPAALAGLLLTFASTHWALVAIARRRHRETVPRVAYVAVALVGALGVYFGRFARWNSWDVVTRPARIAGDFLERMATSDPWVFTAIFGTCLAIAQVIFWIFTTPPSPPRDIDPAT
jgi:uncharacterized membrane protein